ncbi:hypothetical protein QBZ16_000360 [Prototheca wickerhamii]|uniref:Clathrin/coatomer adaptor adaptin-like N-terminal domain-containing protein n=1 Tax=Prototheca wickerhamii TaxID=3111 RepID=A0AAD9MJV3_PROWI|nr:hypothetical protein QBZ16_000360 [Prototheca wickerhamii]
MSGLSSTLSSLAKRSIPITSGFNDLVRGIGEAKSKDEEDGIVAKMVDLCRGALAGGRRDPRTSKELLLYLVYIDMLGHDTRWAHAWVIQLCSDKSLIVKKAAYLAASLLLPAESELHIMLTATIQADFRSDNWVVVATALTATNRIATAELAAVFVPAVIALTSHASQPVARRALLTLRRLLQLDPEAAPDVERVLVERLGHREPALMAAALCSLRELVARRPPQYAGLARYLVAILKQAYEGKLGRGFEVHRAPAPFVQVELLRLLRLLGAGNPGTAAEAAVVVAEAQRRAEGLGSALGAAVALEALRTRGAAAGRGRGRRGGRGRDAHAALGRGQRAVRGHRRAF